MDLTGLGPVELKRVDVKCNCEERAWAGGCRITNDRSPMPLNRSSKSPELTCICGTDEHFSGGLASNPKLYRRSILFDELNV